jgi:hypothetical protein
VSFIVHMEWLESISRLPSPFLVPRHVAEMSLLDRSIQPDSVVDNLIDSFTGPALRSYLIDLAGEKECDVSVLPVCIRLTELVRRLVLFVAHKPRTR